METTAYIALSRQTVLRRQMDVVANNMANMTTTGFKAELMNVEPVLVAANRREDLAYVQDFATTRDTAPGSITATGDPLDLAIEGDGYFAIRTAAGERYTRAGQFQLNEIGEIVTIAGDALLNIDGAAFVVPPQALAITVAPDGTISTDQAVVGRIGLATFEDEQALRKVGGGLYATDEPPLPAAAPRILQGSLEGSNVAPILEMTTMMATVRAYEGVSQLVDTHNDLQRRAIERLLDTQS